MLMKLNRIAVLAAGLTLAAAAHAQSGPVAKVNGVTIPQSRADILIKEMAAQGRPDTPEMRDAIKQELINREIVAQEALKKGLDKKPEVAIQIDLQRQAVLINAYLQDYLKANPVTDDEVKKEYERVKESAGAREYKVRHILVESEDEAKQITAQLKKGASFEKLAGEKSKDQGSKGRGGDLDWATPARYVPAFGQAITKLKKGQVTDAPVQTQFGWHVIRVDDERPAKFPAFEEAKPQIEQQLRQQTVNKAFTDLRAKA
ncbi:MAG: peptidylprolyl isomerase, partial [Burkholderiales bacterium]